ncbi:bile salt-activated lipase-like [Spodoptera litura]|uniref:Bile salt-activated lipase-like n=1 Tax=Spodoptera litura TaxID=69820 RepID=A0A9J7EUB6_SPOLT|nr:bile salt-activated lipase-like [Spodoptera litura]
MAERILDIGGRTVYRYVFSYSGNRNLLKILFNLNATGAIHADELGYLFDNVELFGEQVTSQDQLMIDRLTTLWTNFAKYGDPTPAMSDLLPVKWQPITKTSQPYLNLDSDLTLGARPFHDRMAFWDLFYKLYRNQQKYGLSGK